MQLRQDSYAQQRGCRTNRLQPLPTREQVNSMLNILVVIETNTVGGKYRVCFLLERHMFLEW